MKKTLGIIVVLLVILGGFYFFSNKSEAPVDDSEEYVSVEVINADLLVGTWISYDDENFVRKLNADGTFEDSYTGSDIFIQGEWRTFSAEDAPEDFPYPIEMANNYLVLSDSMEAIHFAIVDVTNNTLLLMYLEGGVLRFNRSQQ